MTCATCQWALVWPSNLPDLATWPLVCNNTVRIVPSDPGLTMPVFGRRVPNDFGCTLHQPKPRLDLERISVVQKFCERRKA